MFEKEAEETVNESNWLIPQSKELAKEYWQKGATFGYNKVNEEAKDIINELLINGYDESTRAKALDFLYPDKE